MAAAEDVYASGCCAAAQRQVRRLRREDGTDGRLL
jgi:hypothetical protein